MLDFNWLSGILNKNKNKSFVKRILFPKKYPSLNLGPQTSGTHLMVWGQMGKKYVVYPTILYDGEKLIKYDPNEAWKHVSQTGNYIEFDSAEEADWFSKHYKDYWGE